MLTFTPQSASLLLLATAAALFSMKPKAAS